MLPLRTIFEALGVTVSWDQDTSTIKGTKGSKVIIMQVDNKSATVDGTEKTLDVAPTVIDGRTLVPVRFISESLGCSVDWDDVTETVSITVK